MRYAIQFLIPLLAIVSAVQAARGQDTLTVQGLVRSYQGTAVEGAAVWLRQGASVHTAQTDARGAFNFDKLAHGATEIVVYKEGYALGGALAYMAGPTRKSIRLERPGKKALRVLNVHAKPIPGARVKSLSIDNRFYVAADVLTAHGFPTLRSDDDGYILLSLLPDKRVVQLTLTHDAYADADRVFFAVDGGEKNVVLTVGVPLYLQVVNGEGEAIENAELLLVQPSKAGRRKRAGGYSDRDGLLTMRAPRGEYLLVVRHQDYGSPTPSPLILDDSERGHTQSITLPPARIITGSVEFPDGGAAAGVRVFCREGKTIHDDVLTGRDGRFRLKMGASTGVLTVVPPRGYMTEVLADISMNLGETLAVEVKAIRLARLPVITGMVKDLDGAPLANALITSLDLPVPCWAITGEDGAFSISLGYMPNQGKVKFRAEHPLRFLRRDFETRLKYPEVGKVRLRTFEPDQERRPPEYAANYIEPLAGKPAPPIVCGEWFNSEPLDLDALRGKVVVLTFWAGFIDSPAGINRIEELRALDALLRDVDDVAFVLVHDSISDPDEVQDYLAAYRIEFPTGRDMEPLVTFDNYGINFTPQTVLIGKGGVLRYYQVDGRLLELIKVLRREG